MSDRGVDTEAAGRGNDRVIEVMVRDTELTHLDCRWNQGYCNAFRNDKQRSNRHSVGLGGNISQSIYSCQTGQVPLLPLLTLLLAAAAVQIPVSVVAVVCHCCFLQCHLLLLLPLLRPVLLLLLPPATAVALYPSTAIALSLLGLSLGLSLLSTAFFL